MPAYITPKTFRFLGELARHNDREWFNANKQRYLDEVRDPLLDLVEAFGPKLAKISPKLVADPRPVGARAGSAPRCSARRVEATWGTSSTTVPSPRACASASTPQPSSWCPAPTEGARGAREG